MKYRYLNFLIATASILLFIKGGEKEHFVPLAPLSESEISYYHDFFNANPEFKADGFDFPVGKPNAEGYYVAQDFRSNNHLGEDWNGRGGGNTDFGDPVYAIADGYVKLAKEFKSGWGNIIRMVHYLEEPPYYIVESLYAHCDEIYVKKGQTVKRGDLIGTIGNVNGLYAAHLHLEMRSNVMLPIGTAYSDKTEGYMDPTDFINLHRPQ
jgi:murein DD-endopeptidase MepM/ murein hydrolase activator NlpD